MSKSILFAQFCYAGNGGVATVLPEFVPWYAKVSAYLEAHEEIDRIGWKRYGDIPLSMERNRVIRDAKDEGFDIIVMLDSDNVPDLYLGVDAEAKPFIETSLEFLLGRAKVGLPTVVCAPYCGPPPHPTRGGEENVYVFHFESTDGDGTEGNPCYRLKAYDRNHAAIMRGIQPIAAGPTGVTMYSMDALDLLPVGEYTKAEVLNQVARGEVTPERAEQLLAMESWFFYEHPDQEQTRKSSTEDVTNTREIQFAAHEKFGKDVVFCNWDSWAGHGKPRMVGKPIVVPMESVTGLYREAVTRNVSFRDRIVEVDFTNDGVDSLGPLA